MAGEPCSYWMQCTLLASFIYIGWWAMSWLHACYSNLCSSYLVNVLISGWVPQLDSKCMFQIFFYLKNSCHVGRNLESKLKNVQFVQNLPLIGCTSLKAWWKLVCMLTKLTHKICYGEFWTVLSTILIGPCIQAALELLRLMQCHDLARALLS